MPAKKYEEWIEPDNLLRVTAWFREGLDDRQVSHNMGICKSTFYEWQNKFPQLREAVKAGKAPVDEIVENAFLKRATGGKYTEEIIEETLDPFGNVVSRHRKKVTREVPPDTAAAWIWLKNRKPQRWKEKQAVVESVENTVENDIIAALRAGVIEDE